MTSVMRLNERCRHRRRGCADGVFPNRIKTQRNSHAFSPRRQWKVGAMTIKEKLHVISKR